jgi:hypothetical protein
MNFISTLPKFREGDQVVLARGSYQGSFGVFLRLREDARWADIAEGNGSIRSHPVEWLAHSEAGFPLKHCGGTRTGIANHDETGAG